jgi:hypothetical protein
MATHLRSVLNTRIADLYAALKLVWYTTDVARLVAWLTPVSLALLLAVAGRVTPPTVQADGGDCASNFAGVPPGPEAPVNFRFQDTTLWWENRAANSNCLAIEIKPYIPPGLRTRSPEQWLPFATIYVVDSTSYAVPAMASGGEVCFRMYAANQHGRSPYTREVCLLPEQPATATPTPVWGIGATPERTPTPAPTAPPGGSLGQRPAVVIVVALLVAAVVGLLVLRWRARGRG